MVGDAIRWGGNDIGVPGRNRVVVDGASDSFCSICGYDGDWDFYVYIENSRIVRVIESDGSIDFVNAEDTYLDLGEGPSGATRPKE